MTGPMYLANWEAGFLLLVVTVSFVGPTSALTRERAPIAPARVGCSALLGVRSGFVRDPPRSKQFADGTGRHVGDPRWLPDRS